MAIVFWGASFKALSVRRIWTREHTSRDLSLTAKIPDVFEAKLVFSEVRNVDPAEGFVPHGANLLGRPLSDFEHESSAKRVSGGCLGAERR